MTVSNDRGVTSNNSFAVNALPLSFSLLFIKNKKVVGDLNAAMSVKYTEGEVVFDWEQFPAAICNIV